MRAIIGIIGWMQRSFLSFFREACFCLTIRCSLKESMYSLANDCRITGLHLKCLCKISKNLTNFNVPLIRPNRFENDWMAHVIFMIKYVLQQKSPTTAYDAFYTYFSKYLGNHISKTQFGSNCRPFCDQSMIMWKPMCGLFFFSQASNKGCHCGDVVGRQWSRSFLASCSQPSCSSRGGVFLRCFYETCRRPAFTEVSVRHILMFLPFT